jgi:hypothetical protein
MDLSFFFGFSAITVKLFSAICWKTFLYNWKYICKQNVLGNISKSLTLIQRFFLKYVSFNVFDEKVRPCLIECQLYFSRHAENCLQGIF